MRIEIPQVAPSFKDFIERDLTQKMRQDMSKRIFPSKQTGEMGYAPIIIIRRRGDHVGVRMGHMPTRDGSITAETARSGVVYQYNQIFTLGGSPLTSLDSAAITSEMAELGINIVGLDGWAILQKMVEGDHAIFGAYDEYPIKLAKHVIDSHLYVYWSTMIDDDKGTLNIDNLQIEDTLKRVPTSWRMDNWYEASKAQAYYMALYIDYHMGTDGLVSYQLADGTIDGVGYTIVASIGDGTINEVYGPRMRSTSDSNVIDVALNTQVPTSTGETITLGEMTVRDYYNQLAIKVSLAKEIIWTAGDIRNVVVGNVLYETLGDALSATSGINSQMIIDAAIMISRYNNLPLGKIKTMIADVIARTGMMPMFIAKGAVWDNMGLFDRFEKGFKLPMILGPNQEADLEKIIIKLGELQTERGILASIGLTAGMALIMLGAGAINFNLNILGSIQNLWWEMDNRLMGSTPWNPA